MGLSVRKILTRAGLMRAAGFAVSATKQLASEAAVDAVGQIADHFRAHQTAVADAAQSAFDRSWTALELWLDRERFLGKLSSREDRDLRAQLDVFFRASGPWELHGSELAFRRRCLAELHRARQSGFFDDDSAISADSIVREVSEFGHFADPTRWLERQREVFEQLPLVLRPRCPHLADLLARRSENGPPFLLASFDYYFTDALSRDDALHRKLSWLADRQRDESLDALRQAQDRSDGRLQALRAELAEFHGRIEDQLGRIVELLERKFLVGRPLTSRDGFSISDEAEREVLMGFRDYWRSLDSDERSRCCDLLRHKIKGEFGMGEFRLALEDAEELARLSDDPRVQAEAHFHVYQSALERRSWDQALAALLRAIKGDRKFEPFPMSRYVPQRILGVGGFGVVFQCLDNYHDDDDSNVVVVKALSRDATFRDVGRLRNVRHESVIEVYDGEYVDREAKDRPYVSMAYFDGVSLDDWIGEHGPLPPRDAIAVLRQVASALAFVHDRRILHRDVKPGNILVKRKSDGGWEVRLIDFGLAQKLEISIAASTGRGQSLGAAKLRGTLDYMAPEQKIGHAPNYAGDIYSFGRAALFAVVGTPYPNYRRRQALPPSLDRLLDECCDEDPTFRPRNFKEIERQLAAIETELGAEPESEPEAEIDPIPVPEPEPIPPPPPGPAPSRIAVIVEEMPPNFRIATQVHEPGFWAKLGGKSPETIQTLQFAAENRKYIARLREMSRKSIPMRRLEPGPFWLGSPDSDDMAFDSEKPRRLETIPHAFAIGIYPVTQAQYRLVLNESPSHFKGEDRPVENVSWFDAARFCNALSEREGIAPYYLIQGPDQVECGGDRKGYRLPNEIEWEYAARGGTETRFPWGDDPALLEHYAWFGENSGGQTHSVGEKAPNPFGLYDTLGNVWEWCDNCYESKYDDILIYRGDARVLRGGSYFDGDRVARPANRCRDQPANRGRNFGFRVARALP